MENPFGLIEKLREFNVNRQNNHIRKTSKSFATQQMREIVNYKRLLFEGLSPLEQNDSDSQR